MTRSQWRSRKRAGHNQALHPQPENAIWASHMQLEKTVVMRTPAQIGISSMQTGPARPQQKKATTTTRRRPGKIDCSRGQDWDSTDERDSRKDQLMSRPKRRPCHASNLKTNCYAQNMIVDAIYVQGRSCIYMNAFAKYKI